MGLVALVAALGLASAPACSSNSGPKYPNLVSFCNGQASAECNQQVLAACGLPSQATCVTQRQAICVAAAPQGTTYNPSAAEGCVNQVSSAYADAQLTLNESNAISSACAGVFDGPGDKDAACKTDQDCKLSTGLKCVLTA
ncbi:MAG: hypothetical protein JOZ69_04675, partial [Myxococcales bacterium]|nr:hypothetical protein [Myxococcales bacterium]